MATEVDLEMHAGDTKTIDITFEDDGQAIDISDAEAITFALLEAPGGLPVLEKTLGAGIAIQDGPAGVARVTLAPPDTEDLAGALYHEAQLTEEDSTKWTGVYGRYTIHPTHAEAASS